MTKEQVDAVLIGVRSWPAEDKDELAELAREIEARRTGLYVLDDNERAAIAHARRGPIASDEVAAFWKRHGIAMLPTNRTPVDKYSLSAMTKERISARSIATESPFKQCGNHGLGHAPLSNVRRNAR